VCPSTYHEQPPSHTGENDWEDCDDHDYMLGGTLTVGGLSTSPEFRRLVVVTSSGLWS
jgi:hypothetical protein